MITDLLYWALAITWLVGALAFWPIAWYVDRRPSVSFGVLRWLFLAQLAMYLGWGVWLLILRLFRLPHVEGSLIMLYLIGAVFWLASLIAFVDWYIGHRRYKIRAATEGQRAT